MDLDELILITTDKPDPQGAQAALVRLSEKGAASEGRWDQVAWQVQTTCLAALSEGPEAARQRLAGLDLTVRQRALPDWLQFTREVVCASWLRVLRNQDPDLELAQSAGIARLRELQTTCEAPFLEGLSDPLAARHAALELVALYFAGAAAELQARAMSTGGYLGPSEREQVDTFFERALKALSRVPSGSTHDLVWLLSCASRA